MTLLLKLTGIICIAYFIFIVLYAGVSSLFPLFWCAAGGVLLGAAWMINHIAESGKVIPPLIKMTVIVITGAALLLFVVTEVIIIRAGTKSAPAGQEYVIVLGAQVKGEAPSRVLRRRVETAAEYLKQNPATKVIVSGGQGPGEDISEAECMQRLLIELGIGHERIIKEDQSTNTDENFQYSLEIAGTDSRFVVVTCNFHMYRALKIAQRQGAVRVSAYASASDLPLLANYYVREFFAVVKYKLAGQI